MLDAQLQTLAAAIRAETNQACVDALAIRNDVAMEQWINSDSAQSAWNPAMTGVDMFEVTDVTKFDGLVAGKREAWRLMLDFAPINFGKQKFRKAVTDAWGTTDSKAILAACTRPATNGEKYLGGTTVTENTISARKLNFSGNIPIGEISKALNLY